jgi:hypothetical protein
MVGSVPKKVPIIPIDLHQVDWDSWYNIIRRRAKADPPVIFSNSCKQSPTLEYRRNRQNCLFAHDRCTMDVCPLNVFQMRFGDAPE